MSVDVVDVDPRGDDVAAVADVVAVADVLAEVLRADRPDDPVPTARELRASALAGLPERDPAELVVLLLAVEGGRALGCARLELPRRDNTHLAYVEVHVRPGERRRGVGTGLLAAAADRSGGRSVLATDLDEPPALRGRSSGRAFLTAHGYVEELVEVRRDLALPVPPDRLDALEREAVERSAGYAVVGWRDRCPDDLVDARAALGTVMSVDAPVGGMDWQQEHWDAARVREREALLAAQGRSSVVAAAVHEATGELVAFTELSVRTAAPEHAEQWETLVLAAHRGHRLGLLVKVAAVRRLAVEHPGARRVATANADTNRWMIAVNEALGFVPNGASSSWQRPLEQGVRR